MNQKGFINIILAIIIVALVGAGVYFVSMRQIIPPTPGLTPTTPSQTPKPSQTHGTANFTASNTSGGEPLMVYFSVNIGDADPRMFYIDPGNGQTVFFYAYPACASGTCSNPIIVTYRYTSVGTYTAKLMRTVPVRGEDLGSVMITVTTGPNIEKIIKKVSDEESSFLIQKINADSVEGLWYNDFPLRRPSDKGASKTLHIGDDIGHACAGVSEKLTNIDFSGQTITFTKVVGKPPFGGCPKCLSGNTLIDTPSGFVAVKNLQVGMLVWTIDKTGQRVSGLITKTSRVQVPPTHRMVHLVLGDGRELFVSPGHPTIDGRIVGNLTLGDLYDNALIVSVERVPYSEGVTYDILPSGDTGFYWANGVFIGSTLH